jgi:hypothetical protein
MNFTEEFLNEFRKTIKDILLEGDLERLKLAKQFLGFDNKVFGDFLAPLLKEEQELVLHHSLAYSETPQNLVAVSSEDHNSLSHGESPSAEFLDNLEECSDATLSSDELSTQLSEPTYKWCPRTFSQDARGSLCGIVLLTERGFEIEDVETGEVLYDNNFEVYKRFDLSHGLVISFNLSGPRIYDISYEMTLEPKTGFTYVENCPLNKDTEGYYVPSDSEGNSLRDYSSRCGVFNLNDYLVKNYRLATAHSVDLVIKEGELPRLAWVHQDNKVKPITSSVVSSKPSRTFAKYDFDLKGKKVAILGLPKSQVERFRSLVLTEKKAEALEVIDSSSHNDTELAPDKLKDFDIVIVVKRFVGHGTIYHLKTLLEDSQAQLISSSSHGLDGLERALYRGVKGYPSEEGATVVDYPLL